MNYYLKISTLFLCLLGNKIFTMDEYLKLQEYKKYFEQQEEIYQELSKLGICGASSLSIDDVLAEAIIATCPKEVEEAIAFVNVKIILGNQKNIILHGISGTGKSFLAQAIAIKNKIPFLFFNTENISTMYTNSVVQNLNIIFEYVEKLEKRLSKPCIIIFDELDALIKKSANKNNSENDILISFWQQLEKLQNKRVVVIGTINGNNDIPVQITNRTSMVKISLPKLKQREVFLSYCLKVKKNKYQLIYPEGISGIAANVAWQTIGLSYKDLQSLVNQVTMPIILEPALPDSSNKVIMAKDFAWATKQLQKDFNVTEIEKLLTDGDILAKPTGLATLISNMEWLTQTDLSPVIVDKIVKLFIAHECNLNALCAYKEYEKYPDLEPLLYPLEQKVTLLDMVGFYSVWVQILIDNGAQVYIDNHSALISLAVIVQRAIEEECQGVPEKFFAENEFCLQIGKSLAIMFHATSDEDRANFLAKYSKIASVLKLV